MIDLIAALLLAVIAIASIISTVVIVTRGQRLDAERHRDLLDRLMSRDLNEYKTATTEPEPIPASDPVDLDDEEEWAREIEMMKVR